MNRRSFLGKLSAAVAGFAILPPATTYSRIWKAQKAIPAQLVPYWIQTKRVTVCYDAEYARACTLTHASIRAMTPADFENAYLAELALILPDRREKAGA